MSAEAERRWAVMSRLGAMTAYTVRSGDTLSGIGQRFGAPWRQLYEHPVNAAFRRMRPDPNLIVVGDLLYVPATERPS